MSSPAARRPVTVIIPTHARPDHLARALACVVDQTLPPDEVLVVDDVGDAATSEVVSTAAATGLPVRLVRNAERPGACHSRNLGAATAASDRLAFLDDDDFWLPTHLERCVALLDDSGADFVLSGILRRKTDGSRVEMWPVEGLVPATAFSRWGFMTGSNLVIVRSAYDRVGGFDPAVAVFNDWDLFFRLLAAGMRYACVAELLVEWREHDGERITTPSLRRADGLDFFVARHGDHMPAAMRRTLRTTALGIRRAHAGSLIERITLAARLAFAYGPVGSVERLVFRRGRSGFDRSAR